jgi:hypothetical protein
VDFLSPPGRDSAESGAEVIPFEAATA